MTPRNKRTTGDPPALSPSSSPYHHQSPYHLHRLTSIRLTEYRVSGGPVVKSFVKWMWIKRGGNTTEARGSSLVGCEVQ